MNKRDVYITYRSINGEGQQIAEYLIKMLSGDGYTIFYKDDILNGMWRSEIQSAIDECTDFIVIIDDQNLGDFIKSELLYAFAKNKNILPIITENVHYSELRSPGLFNLQDYQYIRIAGHNISNDDYEKLKKGLSSISISEKNQIAKETKKEIIKSNVIKEEKKKNINEIVKELKFEKIEREHSRVQWWYRICISLFFCLIVGFGLFMWWNVTSINKDSGWETIIIRVLISMSFLSMIFILMNQAARSRKNLVLLSKEIQEYDYIGALLKGKVDYSTNEEETNKAIDSTFDKMIEQHLTIQKQRLEKEDHTEVKDITPDILNFFKENTSTMMGNYNEMQKNILDLHKTIVQTLKDDKEKK